MTTIDIITTQASTGGASLLLQGIFVVVFAGVLYYLRERNQGKSKKFQQQLADHESQSAGAAK